MNIESTPESSPERDNGGGVRLPPPAKTTLDANEMSSLGASYPSTDRGPGCDAFDESGCEYSKTGMYKAAVRIVNGCSPSEIIAHPTDAQHDSTCSHSEKETHDGDRNGSASPDRDPRRQSLIIGTRLRPLRLPERFVPDISTSPERSRERPSLDGAVSPTPPNSMVTGEDDAHEHNIPSTFQRETEHEEYPRQVPPAYQARPLNVRRRQRDRLLGLLPSRCTRRKLYQWFRLVFLDIVVLFIFLVITGIILLWGKLWHWEDRLFPMTFDPYSNTWYGPVEFSYPQHDFILGITTTGIMIPLIPLAVILLTQYWIRSWLDFHAAFWALKKAMIMMYVISAARVPK